MKLTPPRPNAGATPASGQPPSAQQNPAKDHRNGTRSELSSSPAPSALRLSSLPNELLHEIVTKAAEEFHGLQVPNKKDLQALLSFAQTNKRIHDVVGKNTAFLAAQEQLHLEHELETFVKGAHEVPSDALKAHLSRDELQVRFEPLSGITLPQLRAVLREIRAPKSIGLQRVSDSVEAIEALPPAAFASLRHLGLSATGRNIDLLNKYSSHALSEAGRQGGKPGLALRSLALSRSPTASFYLVLNADKLSFLAQAKGLQSLSLERGWISENDFSPLLASLPPLTAWRFEDSHFALASLSSLLAHSAETLETLSISGTIEWNGEPLNLSLTQAPKLKHLELGSCYLAVSHFSHTVDPVGIASWLPLLNLSSCKNLEKLVLLGDPREDKVVRQINFSEMTGLRSLAGYLGGKEFGWKHALSAPNLEYLSIQSETHEMDMESFLIALRAHPHLRELHLLQDEMSPEEIASILKSAGPSLRSLTVDTRTLSRNTRYELQNIAEGNNIDLHLRSSADWTWENLFS